MDNGQNDIGIAAVLGSTGFVGRALCDEIVGHGWKVLRIRSPRLLATMQREGSLYVEFDEFEGIIGELVSRFEGVNVVVNAAGLARPSGRDVSTLFGANALLPIIVGEAFRRSGVERFIHVSSASVQGDSETLDESDNYSATTTYAQSKALGEQRLLAASTPGVTILRPTSVHGPDRRLTQQLARFARSPLSSVMAPGENPTPQVLNTNVAAVVSFLCRVPSNPPPIVLQPWEGWTTSSFLRVLSGRQPRQVPQGFATASLRMTAMLSKLFPVRAQHRRLEILWIGQKQSPGWLESVGYRTVHGSEEWESLARTLSTTE